MLRIGQCYVVLKGHYFHNRRSLTCGRKAAGSHCLKGRTDGAFGSPAFQAEEVRSFSLRRSMTCGYENYILSGRRDIDPRSAKAPAFVALKASVPACGMSGDMLLARRRQSLRRAGVPARSVVSVVYELERQTGIQSDQIQNQKDFVIEGDKIIIKSGEISDAVIYNLSGIELKKEHWDQKKSRRTIDTSGLHGFYLICLTKKNENSNTHKIFIK